MTFGQLAAADLRTMIAEWPVPFTYRGVEYIGTVSGKNTRRPLEIGGFHTEPEVSLVINLKDAVGNPTFAQAPAVNDDIVVGHTRYRVDRTELDEFSESIQLDLRSPT